MSFDDLRPFISGILGIICALLWARAYSRRMPDAFHGKSVATLLRENKVAIRFANGIFVATFVALLTTYRWGGFAGNDFRPLGIGFGVAFSAPTLTVYAAALWSGREAREALLAYSLAQKIPLTLLLAVSATAVLLLAGTIIAVLW